MEREFKRIIDKYEQIYSGLENEDYSELENYLLKKINSPILSTFNSKKILKHMDIILKYTNRTNRRIFLNKNFVNQKGFVKSFISNMKYYPHKDSLVSLATTIYLPSEKLFNQDFIDEFIRINPEYFHDLYFYLSSTNKTYLLGECLRHKIDISRNISYFDDMDKPLIFRNISEIASFSDYLFNLKTCVESDKKASISLKEYMDEHPIQCINSMLINKIDKDDLDKFNEIVYLIVKDICENEAVNISDIEFLFEGACSVVYKIGNKVIKLSRSKLVEKLPNNPYIIKPLLRKKFEVDNKEMFVEVQEMIDTSKRVSKDQLSEIYTKLRKIGLIWNDPSEFNVGYLEKDNELYWRFPINPCDETLNFKEKRGNDSLKKGDLIIIDNDSIYEETNPPEKMTHSIYYERLYLIELQGLIHELKNETDEAIFNTKCLEHGFKPEYIRNIIENHKPYTLNIGKKHEIR